jgi:hypothetical protein
MMLPEANELMLTEKTEEEETVPITRQASSNIDKKMFETRYIEEPPKETPISIRHVTDSYPIREEQVEVVPILRKREERPVVVEYVPTIRSRTPLRAVKKAAEAPKRTKGAFLLKVTILSIAAIFIAVTYLAFTSKDIAEGGEGNKLINFLTGVSTVESHK